MDNLICYCFKYTECDIEADIKKHRKSTIEERIKNEKKAGGCQCTTENPKGRWCLADVRRVVDKVLENEGIKRAVDIPLMPGFKSWKGGMAVKVSFGSFEVSSVKINFAYEGKNIWVNVADMSDFIAGGQNMGIPAGYLVADAERRDPSVTEEKAVKLPVLTSSGEASTEYRWYYRIDLDLDVFGLHPDKSILVETEIHQPLIDALSDVLDQQ